MSVMNMNSRMAMAEKLSVQQLQQAIQSGSLPAYIGIPLIEQKTKEKAQMAAAQQGQEKPPSVAASILQQAEQQEQQPPGIDQLPSNLPMMDEGENGMASGGIVAFADEGQVVDPNAPPVPAVPPAVFSKYGGIESMSPEGRATFAEYAKELKDLRGKGGSEREQAKNFAIFQAGLGMMGGTSPNAFANIAAGAAPAVTQYQSALKDIRKEDRDTLKQMLDLGMSKEKFLIEANRMGVDLQKAQIAYDATMGAARLRANAEKTPRAVTSAELDQQEVARAAKIIKNNNPNMSQEQAESQAYRDILRIRNPDPSNLSGVGPIVAAQNAAVFNDPAVINAQKVLRQAELQGEPESVIATLSGKLRLAQDNARTIFNSNLTGVQNTSNRPAGAGGAGGTGGAGGAGGAGGTGGGNAPKEKVVNGVKYVLRADGKYYPEEK